MKGSGKAVRAAEHRRIRKLYDALRNLARGPRQEDVVEAARRDDEQRGPVLGAVLDELQALRQRDAENRKRLDAQEAHAEDLAYEARREAALDEVELAREWYEARDAGIEDPWDGWWAPGYPTEMDEMNANEADDYRHEFDDDYGEEV